MHFVHTLLLVLLGVPVAQAQDYPTRNVTFIVPTGAGAGTDLLARILAPRLGERLGKSFVVENRPGAGTVVAALDIPASDKEKICYRNALSFFRL